MIGCAYLGAVAHDKSEMEQWKNTVEHMGKEYKVSLRIDNRSLLRVITVTIDFISAFIFLFRVHTT